MMAHQRRWTPRVSYVSERRQAAFLFGIAPACFPVKSYTGIYPGAVVARPGYSGQLTTIYVAEGVR